MCLRRGVSPRTIWRRDFGILSSSERSSRTASFAFPFSARAVTQSLRVSWSIHSSLFCFAPGFTWTLSNILFFSERFEEFNILCSFFIERCFEDKINMLEFWMLDDNTKCFFSNLSFAHMFVAVFFCFKINNGVVAVAHDETLETNTRIKFFKRRVNSLFGTHFISRSKGVLSIKTHRDLFSTLCAV